MLHKSEPNVWDGSGRLSQSRKAKVILRAHLREELGERLEGLVIRKQEWSNGGGLHFLGRWRETGEGVVGKLGLGEQELYWTRQFAQVAPERMPKLYASGERLGKLPLGWVLLERVRFGPLGPLWGGAEFEMTLEAGVAFQEAAHAIPVEHASVMNMALLQQWLEEGLRENLPGPARQVVARAEHDYAWVVETIGQETCHHDLHLCNVITRVPPPARSQGLLIDIAAIVQPWTFDAAYLEMMNAGDAGRPGARGLVAKMAELRRARGLAVPTEEEVRRLSIITLAWWAIILWPRFLERQEIADYVTATQRYVEESAVLES